MTELEVTRLSFSISFSFEQKQVMINKRLA